MGRSEIRGARQAQSRMTAERGTLARRSRLIERAKLTVRILFAALFVVGGAAHFTGTDSYVAIMPPYFPAPRLLVYVSGVCEVIGGAALLVNRLRIAAAWGLILLLLAVFPANVHMAINRVSPPGIEVAPWLLWLRLPLQFVLIALLWWCAVLRESRFTDGGAIAE